MSDDLTWAEWLALVVTFVLLPVMGWRTGCGLRAGGRGMKGVFYND